MESLSVLFVCLGNKCRSPMAEATMGYMIKKQQLNWTVDSAGLRDWSIGNLPNTRTIQVLKENGIKTKHIGRMITKADFYNFDYILTMDNLNMSELLIFAGTLEQPMKCKIELLGSYLDNEQDIIITDPYFSTHNSAFHDAYLKISKSCKQFIIARCPKVKIDS